jgi:hypothetical protein
MQASSQGRVFKISNVDQRSASRPQTPSRRITQGSRRRATGGYPGGHTGCVCPKIQSNSVLRLGESCIPSDDPREQHSELLFQVQDSDSAQDAGPGRERYEPWELGTVAPLTRTPGRARRPGPGLTVVGWCQGRAGPPADSEACVTEPAGGPTPSHSSQCDTCPGSESESEYRRRRRGRLGGEGGGREGGR